VTQKGILGGLFVSDDAGESWSLVENKDNRSLDSTRIWYYIEGFARSILTENTFGFKSAPMFQSIEWRKRLLSQPVVHTGYTKIFGLNLPNSKNMIPCPMTVLEGSSHFNGGKTWFTVQFCCEMEKYPVLR